MGKPVQRDGEHSPPPDCLAVPEKELDLETGLGNIWCSLCSSIALNFCINVDLTRSENVKTPVGTFFCLFAPKKR